MLFNSYPFILLFLPLTLIGFFLIGRDSRHGGAAWLALASLFFYGWWNPAYVGLLLFSIVFNYFAGGQLARSVAAGHKRTARLLLIAAIAADLALLGYYKYANFFVTNFNDAAGTHFSLATIVLPLGISFFTFTQIAFLVDAYRGEVAEYRFINYALFVTYFPHLIAGPILHHKEMMPQFERPATYKPRAENLWVGCGIFSIGLLKKVLLADNAAVFSNEMFSSVAGGVTPDFFTAWGGALAYTFQLYFDFSGYSDMAIGCALMFGIRLPLNFFSPYKATSIIEFWRRWHMTLSRFLRDYLYIALGGNRKGVARRHLNLFVTMLLGGLWHGAGWTYVIWGGLHGCYLIANHSWRRLRSGSRLGQTESSRVSRGCAWALTFLAVVIGWVFFRAGSVHAALLVLKGMAGEAGISLPNGIAAHLGPVRGALRAMGMTVTIGGGAALLENYIWMAALMGIALAMPNTFELFERYKPAFETRFVGAGDAIRPLNQRLHALRWRPTPVWAVTVALLTLLGLMSLGRISEFLYFQF